ncbi:Bcser1 [Apiospora phragmitis]|uniref:Bcser1 n=1 Tax=Apiospora phragmitis TaxID=2905665 RepID=A0ABR1X7H8_9PEZI
MGRDHKVTYSDARSTNCKTQTADLCEITTSVNVVSGTTSRSTKTGDCAPIVGCSANVCFNDAVVYPKDPTNVGEIPDLLTNYTGKYQTLEAAGATGLYWVPALDLETYALLMESPDVDGVDYYEESNYNNPLPNPRDRDFHPSGSIVTGNSSGLPGHLVSRNQKYTWSTFWETAVNSLPKKMAMCDPDSNSCYYDEDTNTPYYRYWWDDVGGFDAQLSRGWTVYVLDMPDGFWTTHDRAEFSYIQNDMTLNGPPTPMGAPSPGEQMHNSGIIAHINGKLLGTCKFCRVVWCKNNDFSNWPSNIPRWKELAELYMIYRDVMANDGILANKAVVNMSFGFNILANAKAELKAYHAAGVVLVVSAGNDAREQGKEIYEYPAKFAKPRKGEGWLKNLIVVGATDQSGLDTDWGNTASYITTFAPGENVGILVNPAQGANDQYRFDVGTSYSAPRVAGIAAYLRSLPGPFHEPLKDPKNVKKMISFLAHRYDIMQHDRTIPKVNARKRRPVAWNGQVTLWDNTAAATGSHNCLKDWTTRAVWDTIHACDGLDPNMDNIGNGESVRSCSRNQEGAAAGPSSMLQREDDPSGGADDEGTCPLDPMDPSVQALTFSSASVAQPTCTAAGGCGGTMCSGYYCAASPTGPPPDHQDPQDPNNGKPVPSTTVTRSWSTEPAAPTALTSWSTDLSPTSSTSSTDTSTTTTDDNNPPPTSTPECNTDQCKLDNGNACYCDADGSCSTDSPDCCATATCPLCFCSDTSCNDSSPECCPNNCAWSWTGGGGGGNKKMGTSRLLSDRLAALANASSGAAYYGLWSHTNDSSGSRHVAGYDGRRKPDSVCTETPAWSSSPLDNNNKPEAAGLRTWYAGLTVFNDTCSYLAGVANYSSVAVGAKVGALTCSRWATADCYRANHTDVHDCGTGKVAEELVCQW